MPGRLERLWYRIHPAAAAGLPLPDFLGIGAQKAGTTWLAENLRRHPDVFLPERKELHWFDNKWERPLTDYARHFAGAGSRVKGEITPAYGVLPAERIRFVRRLMPEVRLVLLLRNPVERAWSHVLMELGGRRGRDPAELSADDVRAFLAEPGVSARSDYLGILDRWEAAFPREQIFVGFFEWIRERPRGLLADVFRHLGVTADVDWEAFPADKVIVPTVSAEHKRHRTELLEGSGPAASTRTPCPAEIRAWLRERFAPDLEELARRLGGPAERWLSG